MPGSVFRPIVPVWVKNGDKTLSTYALLDQGANASAIKTELAKNLDMDIVEKMEPYQALVINPVEKFG
jgi:hypothetical protein